MIRGVLGDFGRVVVASLVGGAVQLAGAPLLPEGDIWGSQLLFWDALALTYVVLAWIVFLRSTAGDLEDWARRVDAPSRGLVHAFYFGRIATNALWVVVMGSVFGLVAAAYVLPRAGELAPGYRPLLSALAFAAILVAWLAAHTAFTFHYALHQHRAGGAGLRFPGNEPLTLLDFAYFSFGVGKTLGTTDVDVRTHAMRRTVLLHGLFSFVFNSAVLAVALTYVTAA